MCDTAVSVTDNGLIFAKNSDRDPNEAQVPRSIPAADHPEGASLKCTWIEIPQVRHTHAVAISQPWWMWGAEMGTNEFGLTIGNEAVFTTTKLGEPALLGMDLVRLALERATTTTDAVGVLIDLLERHGQGGPCSHEHPGFAYHNSFLVADRNTAMVVETAGRQWATEEVTARARSISNCLTIEKFADAHRDRLRERVAAGHRRRAITQRVASEAHGVADMIAMLSNHGTLEGPAWSLLNGALSAPCAHAGGLVTSTQTTSSWIADLRSEPLIWFTGTSAPCTSLFAPIAPGDGFPDLGDPSNRFDPGSRWWRHEVLHRLTLRNHAASVARFADHRHRIQQRWLDDPAAVNPAEAVARADALDRDAIDELLAAELADRRPPWLRLLWRRWDRQAQLADPSAAVPEDVKAA